MIRTNLLRISSSLVVGAACAGGIVFCLVKGSGLIDTLKKYTDQDSSWPLPSELSEEVSENLKPQPVSEAYLPADELNEWTETESPKINYEIKGDEGEELPVEEEAVTDDSDLITYTDWSTVPRSRNTQGAFKYKNDFDIEEFKQELKDINDGKTGNTGMFPAMNGYLGNDQYQALYDYTVKITRDNNVFRQTALGTAFIVDFELPKEDELYPKTWYFGTSIETLRLVDREGENINNNFEYDDYPSKHSKLLAISRSSLDSETRKHTQELETYDFDLITDWKVTFVSTNFLKAHPKRTYTHIDRETGKTEVYQDENYQVNFGIIKIVFPTSAYARKITGDWFGKYISKDENGKYIKKPGSTHVNFGAEPITKHRSRYLKERLQLFTGAYPSAVKFRDENPNASYWDIYNHNNFVINKVVKQNDQVKDWDISKASNVMREEDLKKVDWTKGTQLGLLDVSDYKYHIKNDHGETLVGLVDANSFRQATFQTRSGETRSSANFARWKGEPHYPWHTSYLTDNLGLGVGATGAMVIDKDLNMVGIHYQQFRNKGLRNHVVAPIKSEEIWEGNYQVSPKYDLIFGDSRTHSKSHRVFVKNHNKNTWMRQYYGWDEADKQIEAEEQALKQKTSNLPTIEEIRKKINDGSYQVGLFPLNIGLRKSQ